MAGAIFRLYLSPFRRRALNRIKDKISDFTLKLFVILCYARPFPYHTQSFKQSSIACECKKVLFSNLLNWGIYDTSCNFRRDDCSFKILKSLHCRQLSSGEKQMQSRSLFKKSADDCYKQ